MQFNCRCGAKCPLGSNRFLDEPRSRPAAQSARPFDTGSFARAVGPNEPRSTIGASDACALGRSRLIRTSTAQGALRIISSTCSRYAIEYARERAPPAFLRGGRRGPRAAPVPRGLRGLPLLPAPGRRLARQRRAPRGCTLARRVAPAGAAALHAPRQGG